MRSSLLELSVICVLLFDVVEDYSIEVVLYKEAEDTTLFCQIVTDSISFI